MLDVSRFQQRTVAVMREIVESDELKNARIRNSNLSGALLRGVIVSNVSIDTWAGRINGLTINGMDVGPLVEAELDRRHPERLKLRPTTPEEVIAALDAVEAMWSPTIERARRLTEPHLHVRVEGEDSFVETLRHLLFATDAWLTRMVLRGPTPSTSGRYLPTTVLQWDRGDWGFSRSMRPPTRARRSTQYSRSGPSGRPVSAPSSPRTYPPI